jgi:hypothetical protein
MVEPAYSHAQFGRIHDPDMLAVFPHPDLSKPDGMSNVHSATLTGDAVHNQSSPRLSFAAQPQLVIFLGSRPTLPMSYLVSILLMWL